jgi:hypothetical protein
MSVLMNVSGFGRRSTQHVADPHLGMERGG